MILRASLGILLIGGAIIGVYNVFMSIYGEARAPSASS
jgi:hypothetical protein